MHHSSNASTSQSTSSWAAWAAMAMVGVLGLAACGRTTSSKAASRTSAATVAGSSPPSMRFSAANVPGLGMVVVDGRGHTVYLLTTGDHKNVPCEDSTGCTKVWPDLPLPAGTPAAAAGPGVRASLLGTMKLSDGETYPTYGGWLMYEYTGDSGPAQAHGQRISSFGGTWYAITPAGMPAGTTGSNPATTSRGGGNY